MGLCHIFITHTSASLTITENADPRVHDDLEHFLARLVPDGDPHYTHTSEGEDDMCAHIRTSLTNSALSVPIFSARLVWGPGKEFMFGNIAGARMIARLS